MFATAIQRVATSSAALLTWAALTLAPACQETGSAPSEWTFAAARNDARSGCQTVPAEDDSALGRPGPFAGPRDSVQGSRTARLQPWGSRSSGRFDVGARPASQPEAASARLCRPASVRCAFRDPRHDKCAGSASDGKRMPAEVVHVDPSERARESGHGRLEPRSRPGLPSSRRHGPGPGAPRAENGEGLHANRLARALKGPGLTNGSRPSATVDAASGRMRETADREHSGPASGNAPGSGIKGAADLDRQAQGPAGAAQGDHWPAHVSGGRELGAGTLGTGGGLRVRNDRLSVELGGTLDDEENREADGRIALSFSVPLAILLQGARRRRDEPPPRNGIRIDLRLGGRLFGIPQAFETA